MPKSPILSTALNFQEDYPCPICRVGKISQMLMMEAMCCDFCNEIFTVNLELQQVKMPSREPPLIWNWNGFTWTQARLENVELGWGYGLSAIAFIILPTTLIGVTAYYFPPRSHVPLSWIPLVWTVLTFLSHLGIIVWIFIEVYQIPIMAYLRAITNWQNRLNR
ncbi:hypothetical protein RI030_14450 [Aphanizomenon flos-aquae NRERC-008]|uniref:DUF983 domain-containing protein n=1 Tax=Aphanizomenon flos-aquae FACHB-1249 TaxID=2692889 RepID=A0ABR8IS43_APHFL|nr:MULTISPECIES: hypothetical protein [Aphanizomenon]MBD2390238.1 hypothetical protein [Aphanizomenon flos-aquae FACHB-1171]MBD2555823.1 hypothetical protein [Aphanizomenon flos-aquae FACHB-1290]MBD2632153.1 hypothetical protein [Aphanizomenon sp. FACHB-1399]MBD2642947.1 hypothetical protein [Aphanizomenon sp. FACHB-1401]MBD2657106.1 hypothetical protein [Aphanizomenon flos-aquae FACHB-1265]